MTPAEFIQRRLRLKTAVDGAILLIGNGEAARNYPSNTYPFRQDSHFLYFVGISKPDLAVIIEPDGRATLYGVHQNPVDIVWSGRAPSLSEFAEEAGITHTATLDNLPADIRVLQRAGVTVHFLPPYRDERRLRLSGILRLPPKKVTAAVSEPLCAAVARLRAVKTHEEVAQIERALSVSARMYEAALDMIAPGATELAICAAMQQVAHCAGMPQSFTPIVTVHGEVLHNHDYSHTLEDGQLLLIDSGVEAAPSFYASDITRTFPVNGRFDARQRAVYEVVLHAQQRAIEAAIPGRTNRDVHIAAVRTIVSGLKDLGLIRGDTEEAARQGAHSLFFPHGIGHMLGLDVHDMEDLGPLSGFVSTDRDPQDFGTQFLRLTRTLEPGYVITMEPGIYFVPALIEQWRKKSHLSEFINYAEVEKFLDFGGIRIEDDILITSDGCRVLGGKIPKTVPDIEKRMAERPR